MDPVTKPQLRDFCRFCIAKGLMNRNTGLACITAVEQLLEQYGDSDDVANVSVAMEGVAFNNRHPGKMAPGSLLTYQNRVAKTLAEFAKYRANPSAYKPSGKAMRTPAPNRGIRPPTAKTTALAPLPPLAPPPIAASANQTLAPAVQVAAVATEHALALPFPLRPTFLAQVVIPRDLTRDEANRLCAFIQALGQGSTVEVQQ